jgi:hypothetical protein
MELYHWRQTPIRMPRPYISELPSSVHEAMVAGVRKIAHEESERSDLKLISINTEAWHQTSFPFGLGNGTIYVR